MSTVTVLGAAGGAGNAVVTELAARGHDVNAVSRRGDAAVPDGVRQQAADLSVPGDVQAACRGSDVVVMAANIPYAQWTTELIPMVDGVVDATAKAGARLVMVDNLYAYGSPGEPITEATPETAPTRKGRVRRELGQRLLQAHRDGRTQVSIGRFSDCYGPGARNTVVYMLGIRRALADKRPQAFIDADQPHTFAYLPDVARGFATLVERAESDGQAWVLPAAPAITQRELLQMVAREAGVTRRIGTVTRPMLALAGLFDDQLREIRELTAQWDRPYSTDASAFQAALGPIETTPHSRAIAETVAWFRKADSDRGRA
ncbi:MAG: NAD-dependent epimerase/dehydratase family protein [Actinomycetota bacterium]